MPQMHDRYGFILDLFAILYAFGTKMKHRYIIMLSYEAVSFAAYLPYLLKSTQLSLVPVAIAYGVLIFYVGYELKKQMEIESAGKSCLFF